MEATLKAIYVPLRKISQFHLNFVKTQSFRIVLEDSRVLRQTGKNKSNRLIYIL